MYKWPCLDTKMYVYVDEYSITVCLFGLVVDDVDVY